MKYINLILVSIVLASSVSCVSFVNDPGSYRQKKKKVISGDFGITGNSLRFVRHTSKAYGLGTSFVQSTQNSMAINQGQLYSSVAPIEKEENNIRDIYSNKLDLNVIGLMFPWDSSSFFVGFRLTAGFSQYAYYEHTAQFSLDASTTLVEWKDKSIEVGVPIGFSKNTLENVNFFAGISPTKIVNVDRNFLVGGEEEDVDMEKRDLSLETFDSVKKEIYLKYLASIGYAF